MHRHVAIETRDECWQHCVAAHRGDHRTHGNITIVERCACGATRSTESNGGATASAGWSKPPEDAPRAA